MCQFYIHILPLLDPVSKDRNLYLNKCLDIIEGCKFFYFRHNNLDLHFLLPSQLIWTGYLLHRILNNLSILTKHNHLEVLQKKIVSFCLFVWTPSRRKESVNQIVMYFFSCPGFALMATPHSKSRISRPMSSLPRVDILGAEQKCLFPRLF